MHPLCVNHFSMWLTRENNQSTLLYNTDYQSIVIRTIVTQGSSMLKGLVWSHRKDNLAQAAGKKKVNAGLHGSMVAKHPRYHCLPHTGLNRKGIPVSPDFNLTEHQWSVPDKQVWTMKALLHNPQHPKDLLLTEVFIVHSHPEAPEPPRWHNRNLHNIRHVLCFNVMADGRTINSCSSLVTVILWFIAILFIVECVLRRPR